MSQEPLHPLTRKSLIVGMCAGFATIGGLVINLYKEVKPNTAAPQTSLPSPNPAPQTRPLPLPTSPTKTFDQLRDRLVDVLQKGPQFCGTAYRSDGSEFPINFRITWDNGTQRAVGEVNFLAFQRQIRVSGLIAYDRDNTGEVVLSLANTSYDDNSVFDLQAASSSQPQLIGTYRLGVGGKLGTLTLNPNSSEGAPIVKDPAKTKFEQLRDQLVDVLQKGPQFFGTAYRSDGSESPINFRIVWDSDTQRAVGEVNFLAFQRQIKVSGLIAYDRDDPGQVVLSLANTSYDDNSVFNLQAASPGQPQLTGTYRLGVGGKTSTLTLNPKTPEQ